MFAFLSTVAAQEQTSQGLAPESKMNNSSVFTEMPQSPYYWNGRAFGYNAQGTIIPIGPFKFYLNNPGALTSLATDPLGSNFISAGSFDNNHNWWGVRYGSRALVKIDTSTGTITQVGTVTGASSITGLAWDPTTNKMYAMNYSSSSYIGTLNLTTGAFTQIGSGISGLFIDICCSNSGQLYGVNISDDAFYSINKSTGTATLIGSLGLAANFSQGLTWDRSVDSCYWAAFSYTGELRKINVSNGSSSLIGLFNCEVDGFAIPGFALKILHTPLPNTQNVTGPYVINCQIVPLSGNTITYAKIFWSRNNAAVTDSINLTHGSGNNYSGNIPGNGTSSTYRYYLKAVDNTGKFNIAPAGAPASLFTFYAIGTDTSKPVITHTPIGNYPRYNWPSPVYCSVTDPLGIDSVRVSWYKGAAGQYKRFNLVRGAGNYWSGFFNSDTTQVAVGDTIFYRIIARDASAQHNMDSTAQYNFRIINQAVVTIGTGTISTGWPYFTFYMDSRTDMLYLGSEIKQGTGGYITHIGFDVINASVQTMKGFKIKMQNTTANSITAFTSSGWTIAYDGTYTVPGSGWQMIQLQNPFYYQGGKNLLIEICYNDSVFTSNTNVNGTAATNRNLHEHLDLFSGDGCVQITTPGVFYTELPNIRLIINPGPNIGIQQIGMEIPDKYILSQNYPNPFNPVTKITFAIPKRGLVSLKVYDVLGRVTAELVNEIKTAGNYLIDFDASGFASGVYFYKLEVNGFSDVKRMIIIK
jgi:hypothetical protein